MLRLKRTKRRRHKWFWRLVVLFVFFALAASTAGAVVLWSIETPSIESFQERQIVQSTKIYDRTGEHLLWEIHGEEKRTVVPLQKINRNIKNATIALEDSSFYSHNGVSPIAILRSLVVDIVRGEFAQGGSTITQQLVVNTLLVREQTITRKIKEAVIAMKLESTYTKDEILELYLNEIPYGSSAYGVEAAAQTFFGKSSAEVTLAEAAYLASLPNAPTYYSPYGNHVRELEQRKQTALRRMFDLGFIPEEELKQAENERVTFVPLTQRGIKAPHFVMYVQELLGSFLSEYSIKEAGLRVITTLDFGLQQKAEEIISRYGETNEKQFNATNEGLVAIDPRTGDILAMVGSRDYFDSEREGNFNVTLAHRQPGSALKPIVYATALKKGYTPDTVVFDVETNFAVAGVTPYIPSNYDDQFRGPVTLRSALAQSLNVPSVKVLYLAGLADSLKTARDLGITSLTDPDRYGLTLVLGGGEVSLLELTSAYGVFAADGMRAPPHAIQKIEEPGASLLFQYNTKPARALPVDISRTITSILSDDEARAPTFGAHSPLYFKDYPVAVKTGTTNDYKDAWIIGYNPTLVVGAWAGNNNNTSMEKKIAGFIVTPFWREFVEFALAKVGTAPFPDAPRYDNIQKPVLRGEWRGSEMYVVDRASGKLATEFTPPELRETRIITSIHSILRWVDKNNPQGPIPENPGRDSQYQNWEQGVRDWVENKNIPQESTDVPVEFDDVHAPEFQPRISLRNTPQKTYKINDTISVELDVSAKRLLAQLDIFFNEGFVRSQKNDFQTVQINLAAVEVVGKENILTLRLYDDVGNKGELKVPIEIEF